MDANYLAADFAVRYRIVIAELFQNFLRNNSLTFESLVLLASRR